MAFDGTFRHVGYVVEDLDTALDHFAVLFDLDLSRVDVVPPPDVPSETRFAFFEVGGCVFELIHPTSQRFVAALRPDGIRIDHVAFRVPDVQAHVDRLAADGIGPGHVTPDGVLQMPRQQMCYLDPSSTGGILLELVQPDDPGDDRPW